MVPAPQADSLGSAEAVAEGKRSDPGVAERHSLGHPGQEEDMPQVPVPWDRVRWVLRPVSDSMSGEDMTSSRWGRLRQTCPEAVGDRNTHRKRGAEMADRGHHRTRHHPRSLVRHPLVQNELVSEKKIKTSGEERLTPSVSVAPPPLPTVFSRARDSVPLT